MDINVNKQKGVIINLVLFYLLMVTFPYSLIIQNEFVHLGVLVGLAIIYLVFYFYQLRKYQLTYPFINRLSKHSLLLLPLLLATCSNLLYLLIDTRINESIDYRLLLIHIPVVLILAALEELLFRHLILNLFKNKYSILKAIIFSSLLFASIHIINFFQHFDGLSLLIQLGYTFGLGIVCAIIYYETNNILLAIMFHFLFNILNNNLFTLLVTGPTNWLYYLVNVLVVIIISGYLLILMKKKLIKVNFSKENETNTH